MEEYKQTEAVFHIGSIGILCCYSSRRLYAWKICIEQESVWA